MVGKSESKLSKTDMVRSHGHLSYALPPAVYKEKIYQRGVNGSLGSTESSWLLFMHIKQRRSLGRRKLPGLGSLDIAKLIVHSHLLAITILKGSQNLS